MATDYAMLAAQQRMTMRSVEESRMTDERQLNAGGARHVGDDGRPYYDQAPLSEYPMMMYRKTDVEQTQPYAEQIVGLKDAPMVINRYDGLLCDTVIANSLTEAEALSETGWETSPRAAYGLTDGIAKQASAKDEEIERLRAELAQARAEPATERRGPGRPPKSAE